MMKLQDLKKNHCRLTTSLFTVNLGVFYMSKMDVKSNFSGYTEKSMHLKIM